MKIKVKERDLSDVLSAPAPRHKPPVKQSAFVRFLLKTVSAPELKEVGFTCEKTGMEKLAKDEPCLILMNH